MTAVYFALIADRRSGTGMLTKTLNQHPQIDCSGEIFNSFTAVDGWLYNETGYAATMAVYWNWRRSSDRADTVRSVGTLIHRWQAELFPGLWQMTRDLHSRFICIYRDNLLRQLLSETIAMNTWQWGSDPGFTEDLPKVTISAQALRDYITLRYRERSADWQFQPRIECSLERLTADWDNAMGRLQQFIQVDPVVLQPTVQKQERRALQDAIANYDEVSAEVVSLGHPEWLDKE